MAETELTVAAGDVTRDRLTRTIPLALDPPLSSSRSVTAPAPAANNNNLSGARQRRQRRRQAARTRRLELRDNQWRRLDVMHSNNHWYSSCSSCYQSSCHAGSLLLLPLILLLGLVGVILFAIFFCVPLLFFLIGLLCLYYCCTKEPLPPRTLWRALLADGDANNAGPVAPVTPPGLSLEQIQQLIVKRKCLTVVKSADMEEAVPLPRASWGVNLLEQQCSDSNAYWPLLHDNGRDDDSVYYLFSKPLSAADMKAALLDDDEQGAAEPNDEKNAFVHTQDDADAETKEEVKETTLGYAAEVFEPEVDDSLLSATEPLRSVTNDDDADENSKWTCSVCTLQNAEACETCTLCHAPRTTSDILRTLESTMTVFAAAGKSASAGDTTQDAVQSAGHSLGLSVEELHDANVDNLEHCQLTPAVGASSVSDATNGTDVAGNQAEPVEHAVPVVAPDHSCTDLHGDGGGGAVCDICLGDYEAGDVVAWSKNTLCKHAFHVECISDWLVRRPTCPSCRQDYMEIPDVLKREAVMDQFLQLHREHLAAMEMSSALRIGGFNAAAAGDGGGVLDNGVESSVISLQDSVNLAVMMDDTDGSLDEVGSDDNV